MNNFKSRMKKYKEVTIKDGADLTRYRLTALLDFLFKNSILFLMISEQLHPSDILIMLTKNIKKKETFYKCV